ncbi:MAG: quinoprotein relay system zinc metallohydrolase 2 [Burkholderiales bacterium]|nr:quinoprotein relay system zinc metallohydrolase 2 [Burkholderiales bacterium]
MGRRRIAALLLAWMAVAPVRAADALESFAVTEIAPGNFVHYGRIEERSPDNLGDQANIGFIVGGQCVAVIDPGGSLAVGRALRAAIRRITDKPVCWVIFTHVHPDHIFGAAAFREDKAVVVGHENLPRSMAQRARPYLNALKRDLGDLAAGSEAIPPTRLVVDETVLDLGGRSIRLKAWPVAHTDNDVTVLDESTGTLWLGDLLFVDHTPVVDGKITGFIEVLDRLAALEVPLFVPGHGKTAVPWPQALAPERDYLALIVRETRAAIKRRKTIEEATDEVGLTERDKWVNFDDYHRRNVTTAYTELEWE